MWTKLAKPAQVALLLGFWILGEIIARSSFLPLPGSIIGMFILLTLLMTGTIKSKHVSYGAVFFLGHMLLFLIPASMVLIDHRELFGIAGLKILFVIVCSTVTVMLTSGLVTHACLKFTTQRERVGK